MKDSWKFFLILCGYSALFAETVDLTPTDDIAIGNSGAVEQGEAYINSGNDPQIGISNYKC